MLMPGNDEDGVVSAVADDTSLCLLSTLGGLSGKQLCLFRGA
jgi:hypothetical protein